MVNKRVIVIYEWQRTMVNNSSWPWSLVFSDSYPWWVVVGMFHGGRISLQPASTRLENSKKSQPGWVDLVEKNGVQNYSRNILDSMFTKLQLLWSLRFWALLAGAETTKERQARHNSKARRYLRLQGKKSWVGFSNQEIWMYKHEWTIPF